MNHFPRKLTKEERLFLFFVLPEDKPGYLDYRKKIDHLFVTGYGRYGETNLVLGKKNTSPDLSFASTPVFAIGTAVYNEHEIDITIHEEIDDEIEFDISPRLLNVSVKEADLMGWSLSNWKPGEADPRDGKAVREVVIIPGQLDLAICTNLKKLWVYSYDDKVNHLIPVSNFYNHLMLVKNIRSSEIVLKPNLLFNKLATYTDNELLSAFLLYNKYMKRLKIDYSYFYNQTNEPEKKGLLNFLKRNKI